LSGQSPFCQVFFDDVVAKESHRIANENEGWNVEKSHGQKQEIAKSFFYSKAYTIAGGSSEVQLNIIAKHILGLPS